MGSNNRKGRIVRKQNGGDEWKCMQKWLQSMRRIGASLKDAGRLTFAVSKMGEALIPALLDSLRKATSAQASYGETLVN